MSTNNEHKHTPGPWYRGCEGSDRIQIVTVDESDNLKLCVASVFKGVSLNPRTQASEEATANARLISAAPELLEACETTLTVIEADHPDLTASIKRLRAAIDKARGLTLNSTP